VQFNATRYDNRYPCLGEPIVLESDAFESDLAFCTTQELIQELLQRKTFLGVLVQSAQEYRCDDWGEQRIFKVRFSENLSASEAGQLLKIVAQHMNRHTEPSDS